MVKILKGVLLIMFLVPPPIFTTGQRVISLYPGPIPNTIEVPDKESGKPDGVTRVSKPTLTVFLPDKGKGKHATIIICPGGGYGSLVMDREGYTIAKAFKAMGIAAFVLKYRLPDPGIMMDRTTGALQDAQQAIYQVKTQASAFNIDTTKIGMIGFSAGGHLASTAGTHFNQALINNKTAISLRPDFMILVYPVISFSDSLVHKGSMNNLLGPQPSAGNVEKFSNELQVTGKTPPTFLVHAADDIWVPAANSIRFYEALQRNGVNAELHIYSKGGHGFLTYPPLTEWMGRCRNWMISNKWMDE